MTSYPEVIIVGAGPYGLSIAAHLRAAGVTFRIFGSPMLTWREHMPDGMLLKSDGFASNLSDPMSVLTLQRFCEMNAIPYDHRRRPVDLETFRAYGLAFQQNLVPELEDVDVTRIERDANGYRLCLADGRIAGATRIIMAIGITHFDYVPPTLRYLPANLLSHSSAHRDVRPFRGREVAVIGAGASAVDLAVLLKGAGANVTLISRRSRLRFHDPPSPDGPSVSATMRHPGSPIGPGWRSRFYSDFPGLFYRLPQAMRWRIVRNYLAPAPGWPMKERFVGRVPALLGYDVQGAEVTHGRARLVLTGPRDAKEQVSDHVIAATGYRVDVRRLTFLGPEILERLRTVQHTPVLSSGF
jgi:cation diffusion facilitator CzcD-associated flavoprotein CzcO